MHTFTKGTSPSEDHDRTIHPFKKDMKIGWKNVIRLNIFIRNTNKSKNSNRCSTS